MRTGTVASNAEPPGAGSASLRDHDEGASASLPSGATPCSYGAGLLVWSPVAVAAVVLAP